MNKNNITDVNIIIVNLIEDYKFLQEVNQWCTLHKRKSRLIKIADLHEKKLIRYHYGQYKYFDNKKQRIRYITEKIPDVIGKMRHDKFTILKSTEPVLKNQMTILYASEQSRNTFHLTAVPSTIWRWIGLISIDEKIKATVETETARSCSGHGSVDEVYDNGDGIIIITDPVKNTILSATMLDGKPENIDIENEFIKLKKKNIELKSCTKDGSPLYMNTIQRIYKLILLQICIFHFIKSQLKHFLKWHKQIRGELKISKIPRGLKTNARYLKQYLFRKRTLFVKRTLSIEEKRIVKNIIDALPAFRQLRMLFLKFIKIFDSDTLDEAEKRYWDFIAEPLVSEKLPEVQKQLIKYYDKNELFSYYYFDTGIRKKIRTTNHTERVNRKFRKKQKTHYRIRKTTRREKMLEFMVFFHNAKSLKIEPDIQAVLILNQNLLFLLFFQRL
jgi:hypothetical protein